MPLAPEREANNEPAYLLGRIWALMRNLEVAVHGNDHDVNAVWLNKMAATSANPIATLPIYASHSKVWGRKLRNRGEDRVADRLAEQIAGLVDRVEPGARPIGLTASSWFSLGYWHQRVADERDAELVEA